MSGAKSSLLTQMAEEWGQEASEPAYNDVFSHEPYKPVGTGRNSRDTPPTLGSAPAEVFRLGSEQVGTVGTRIPFPADWSAGSVVLFQSWPPPGVREQRWLQYAFDVAALLDGFGAQLHAVGWTTDELFGLHRDPDNCEANCVGVAWLIAGRTVVDVGRLAIAVRDGDDERLRLSKPLFSSTARPAWQNATTWGTA